MTRARIDVRHILCPVDFSEFSARALDHAVRLARFFDADLHVLHVVPIVLDVVEPYPPVLPDLLMPAVEAAEDRLRRFVAPARERHERIETSVREGGAASTIQELAALLQADVVVMGTHGRTGLGRAVLGSVTESVMHHVACPVLTVSDKATRGKPGPPFHRILCATDLLPSSRATVEYALALAGESDAEVELLHVVESLPPDASSVNPSTLAAESDAFRHGLIEDAQVRLSDAALQPASSWCNVTTRVATGEAWRAIVEQARAGDAELIVIGAHAGAFARAFFGSTASRVVRTAPCAVLVLKPPRTEDTRTDESRVVASGRAG
jgi:nucleotide-binding universal stress UspA family protein